LPGVLYPAAPAVAAGPLFVFAHGAGAGQASPFMRHYATLLAAQGVTVVTFDFPYMAAGRKLPDRPPVLEGAFLCAMTAAVARTPGAGALCIGGKSMGGRIATHLAATPERWTGAVPFAGAVAFGYPLRPPGPRGSDRVSHLRRLGVPTLVVQGTRDAFGGPDDVRADVGEVPHLEILPVATGDHSLKLLKSAGLAQADVDHDIVTRVVAWMHGRASR
jgi:uncharacterized protein